jgi:hypothetical protein
MFPDTSDQKSDDDSSLDARLVRPRQNNRGAAEHHQRQPAESSSDSSSTNSQQGRRNNHEEVQVTNNGATEHQQEQSDAEDHSTTNTTTRRLFPSHAENIEAALQIGYIPVDPVVDLSWDHSAAKQLNSQQLEGFETDTCCICFNTILPEYDSHIIVRGEQCAHVPF